jgi:hypothetical protein
MLLRRVTGNSMAPTLADGDIVVLWKRPLRAGTVVMAVQAEREVIKRIEKLDDENAYLVGDNRPYSVDSRHYGKVKRSAILGTVMITLPRAVAPPKLVKPYGVWLGRIAASLLTVFALVHLFRIDTFIPLLDTVLPRGNGVASLVAMIIILTEIFSIPFALRMKLSPLGQYVSGTFVVLAPFWWVLIDIWSLGIAPDTAQLGQFMVVPGTVAVLLVNIGWMIFSYAVLYTLGYGSINVSKLLRKR